MSNSIKNDKMQKLDEDLLREVDERVDEMTAEKPELDPESMAKLDRVEALYHSGAITKDELKSLVKHIFVRSPRFSVVARTQLNYDHLMADFSAAWEEHAESGCAKSRDFVYMCGEWVVKVSSNGVYNMLYVGQSLVHRGIVKPVVFTGVLLYSCIESLVEHLWAALNYVGRGVQKAWNNSGSKDKKSGDTVTLENVDQSARMAPKVGYPSPIAAAVDM